MAIDERIEAYETKVSTLANRKGLNRRTVARIRAGKIWPRFHDL
jgi:hypothetical protein